MIQNKIKSYTCVYVCDCFLVLCWVNVSNAGMENKKKSKCYGSFPFEGEKENIGICMYI